MGTAPRQQYNSLTRCLGNKTLARVTQYTAHVHHVYRWSFVFTILFAVLVAILMVQKQERSQRIHRLLASHAVTDQLQAIELLQNASFDQLCKQLKSIIADSSDASNAAQQLLVKRAFSENRLRDLSSVPLEKDLHESVLWWISQNKSGFQHSQEEQPYVRIVNDTDASPWLRRLAALRCQDVSTTALDDLITMPPRDRDGSVMLTVIAIERHIPPELSIDVIQSWASAYDSDQQKAATLLAALMNEPLPTIPTQNNTHMTIQSIVADMNVALAWRTMHSSDGMINPDVTLAALIVDRERFLPILVETARSNQWIHPEHPVELARRFAPTVTTLIPTELLDNEESRDKWWSLFACGILKENR